MILQGNFKQNVFSFSMALICDFSKKLICPDRWISRYLSEWDKIFASSIDVSFLGLNGSSPQRYLRTKQFGSVRHYV